MVNIGKSIKVALAQNEMSIPELAEELNCSRQLVHGWIKSGSVTLSTMINICAVFKMKVSDFIAAGESDD